MRYLPRELEAVLRRAARSFPAVVLTGPRRSGKTWLLRHLLPGAGYHLLEDPSVVARLRADPAGFLDGLRFPVVLDEVQNVPEVFAMVRARIDREPRRTGRWYLTGSQEAPLMRGVTESMAGRAAVLSLRPLSARESPRVRPFLGGYPEVIARPGSAALWFDSFLRTYLERDVRSVTAVHDLSTFRRFIALLAARHGAILNRTELAGPLGVSIPTVNRWMDVLEATAQILVVPPFFENLGKRLVKSPRVYIADSGLACHLLGIDSEAALSRSPFRGAVFEGFVAGEIVKAQARSGRRPEVWFFRDSQGLEVDFLVPVPGGGISLVECKASRSVSPAMAGPMLRLAAALGGRGGRAARIPMTLVHEPSPHGPGTEAVAPGVKARDWRGFVADL